MKACFRKKKKNSNVTFYLTIQRKKVRISRYLVRSEYKLRFQFLEEKSELLDMNSQLRKKKSELWDITLHICKM